MAALLLLLPSLFQLAAPAAGQIHRVEVVPMPPPFIQAPPMLMNMVDMMERVVNELMPEPMLPPAAGPEVAAEVKPSTPKAARNKSRPDGPARQPLPPPLPEVPIDIKLEPLAGPELPVLLPFPHVVPARAQPVAKEVDSVPRKMIKATASEHNHPHRKIAILEVTRTNGSEPVLQAVAASRGNTSTELKKSGPPSAANSSAAPETSSPPKVVARQPAESAAQQLRVDTGLAAAASGDSATSAKGAKQSANSSPPLAGVREGNDKPTDPTSSSSDSGLASACYGLFLRHGVLILVLSVLCGVSCLVGALLPVLFKRRRGQVSQFPPKRRFTAGRIFADPAMARMFRRRDTMVA